MRASVILVGDETDFFEVKIGVKHGCAIPPVIFTLYNTAATALLCQRIQSDFGIGVTFRLDGSLLNLSQLQAKINTSEDTITELQYVNDYRLIAQTPLKNYKVL